MPEVNDKNKDKDNTDYLIKPQFGWRQDVVSLYDITTKTIDGKDYALGFPFANGSIKTRKFDPKNKSDKWSVVRNTKGESCVGLAGRQSFRPGSKTSVTVVEGLRDMPSMYQALDGRSAVVAVSSSSTALRDCSIKEDFDFLNSFKKIVLAFDSDEPGERAKNAVASLFDPQKVYVTEMTRYKDPHSYLENGDIDSLKKEWESSKKFSVSTFINTFEEVRESLTESRLSVAGTYPHEGLQNALRGFVRGELTVFKGLEGIGKTEVFRAFEYHLLKNHPEVKIGLVHMEEDKSTTIKGIATYEAGYPMYFEEDEIPEEDVLAAYKKAVGEDEDRVYIYKIEFSDDPDDILSSVRSLCVTSGVDVVFIDNINKMVDSLEENVERQKLVYLASRLKTLAQELSVSIVLISHVNDDGKTLGSRYTAKVADKVIHMDRDINSTDEIEKSTVYFTIEKGRLARGTGKVGEMFFDTRRFAYVL